MRQGDKKRSAETVREKIPHSSKSFEQVCGSETLRMDTKGPIVKPLKTPGPGLWVSESGFSKPSCFTAGFLRDAILNIYYYYIWASPANGPRARKPGRILRGGGIWGTHPPRLLHTCLQQAWHGLLKSLGEAESLYSNGPGPGDAECEHDASASSLDATAAGAPKTGKSGS